MTQTVNYAVMSKSDLIGIIEIQKSVIARFHRLLPIPNKVLAPGEKLAWAVAKPLIDKEKPNEKGLVRIPIDEIAQKIGMSDSSASRYISNICERFEATHEVEPYITKKGQQCNLTYINPEDPIWHTDAPDELPLPAEKERTINRNECPHCRSSGTYHVKKRMITSQDVGKCDLCGYSKVYPVIPVNEPFEPGEYLPAKKGVQAEEPFAENEKGPQPEHLFVEQEEKLENLHCLPVDTGCIASQELQALPQWVVWKYEQKPGKTKRDKVPYNVHRAAENARADVSNSDTWASYDEAIAVYEKSQRWHTPYAGVGFVFKAGGGIVGIDYDNSLDIRLNSYSEISVSGNGVHSYVHGSIPKGTRRNGIEMYDAGRFFTWTGNHLAGTPETIEDCQAELDSLYQELAPETIPIQPTPVTFTCTRDDEEILEKARNGRNGSGAKFRRLYDEGNWSGYPSQSEADQALCMLLAYWTDFNVFTLDRLFRQSSLMRDKWDEKRGASTYGRITISKALCGIKNRKKYAQVEELAS